MPRAAARRWRRRGRRAQVAPVATILGLLLVVTFLATYLSTTLPNQMSVNDLNHEVLVENQVGRLSTMVNLLADLGTVGGQTFAPISLGSDATPPFAGPDSAAIGPLLNQTELTVTYTLTGPRTYTAAADPGSGILVSLRNTYAPLAEVAYDEGAVVFAEPGGAPVMEDAPAITLSNGALSVVVPVFLGMNISEAGTATAVVGVRLVADQTFQFPTTGLSLASGSNVVITIITPYAAAWMSYFKSGSAFSAATIACTPASTVCSSTYAYQPGGTLGTVVMTIPAQSLTLTQAYFAVTLA